MRATFGTQKSILVIDDPPDPGRFALDSVAPKQPTWEKCRERFSNEIDCETIGFFFSHHSHQSENVAEFIFKSEEILELSQRSVYSHTDKDIILWIEPSRFWMDCWLKRSLLTILLRCGMYYDPAKDNYEDALFGDGSDKDQAREYVYKTRQAIMRFMFGFTKFVIPDSVTVPTGSLHSALWVRVFEDRSVKELKTILVAEAETINYRLLGIDAIWA